MYHHQEHHPTAQYTPILYVAQVSQKTLASMALWNVYDTGSLWGAGCAVLFTCNFTKWSECSTCTDLFHTVRR